jgi:hypothetical protein
LMQIAARGTPSAIGCAAGVELLPL